LFDKAQICLNGHLINWHSDDRWEYNQNFCEKCGARTIDHCQACRTFIRGGRFDYTPTRVPSYCHSCGSPFPWTANRLAAAKQLAEDQEALTEDERRELSEAVDEVVNDTPGAVVAGRRLSKC